MSAVRIEPCADGCRLHLGGAFLALSPAEEDDLRRQLNIREGRRVAVVRREDQSSGAGARSNSARQTSPSGG